LTDSMTLREASKYLNIPERTLRHYRNLDRGPRSYHLSGKLFFDRTDLDAWVRAVHSPHTARRTLGYTRQSPIDLIIPTPLCPLAFTSIPSPSITPRQIPFPQVGAPSNP
jgi:hypothetical protein